MYKLYKPNICFLLTPTSTYESFSKKKGTRMLKEILKIDSPDTTDSKNDGKQFDNEVTASPNRRDEHGLLPRPEPSKKLGELTEYSY